VRHRLRSAICLAIVALAGILVVGTGCQGQGEGDRCTFFAGNNTAINGTQECASGLVCYRAFNTSVTGDYDRCCLPGLPPTTVQACTMGNLLGGNPTAGADASFDATTTDAASDVKNADVKAGDVEKADVEKDGEIDSAADSSG